MHQIQDEKHQIQDVSNFSRKHRVNMGLKRFFSLLKAPNSGYINRSKRALNALKAPNSG